MILTKEVASHAAEQFV